MDEFQYKLELIKVEAQKLTIKSVEDTIRNICRSKSYTLPQKLDIKSELYKLSILLRYYKLFNKRSDKSLPQYIEDHIIGRTALVFNNTFSHSIYEPLQITKKEFDEFFKYANIIQIQLEAVVVANYSRLVGKATKFLDIINYNSLSIKTKFYYTTPITIKGEIRKISSIYALNSTCDPISNISAKAVELSIYASKLKPTECYYIKHLLQNDVDITKIDTYQNELAAGIRYLKRLRNAN